MLIGDKLSIELMLVNYLNTSPCWTELEELKDHYIWKYINNKNGRIPVHKMLNIPARIK